MEHKMKRECGGCTLCCRLLPVRELHKPDNQRCTFQRTGKGCAVYDKLARVSPSCVLWSCRWLVNDDTADLRRPDHSHYVLDIMPDFITVSDDEAGWTLDLEIVQVWCDPKHPDAHKDPALREYLKRRGEEGIAALIRYSARDAFVLFPPAMTGRDFVEHRTGLQRCDHTVEEIVEGISASKMVKVHAGQQ
jgi:hypothetical protein